MVDYTKTMAADEDRREDVKTSLGQTSRRFQAAGYEVRHKRAYKMVVREDREVTVGHTYVEIATDMALLAASGRVDRFILVSSSWEYSSLLDKVGKIPYCIKGTIINPSNGTRRSAADEFVWLRDIASIVLKDHATRNGDTNDQSQ